jgi:hypothetical protein
MSKFNDWYDSLDSRTKKYLGKQPRWHDSDLFWTALISFVLGVVLGLII